MALDQFAYSFQHAIVRAAGRQYIGVRNVSINQELNDNAVYGTSANPIGHSVGQVQRGRGALTFSDLGEGVDFWLNLAPQPFMALWDLDYSLARGGEIKSFSCTSCRLTGTGVEHESGPDGVEISYPFVFLRQQINSVDGALDVKQLANAAIDFAQSLI